MCTLVSSSFMATQHCLDKQRSKSIENKAFHQDTKAVKSRRKREKERRLKKATFGVVMSWLIYVGLQELPDYRITHTPAVSSTMNSTICIPWALFLFCFLNIAVN